MINYRKPIIYSALYLSGSKIPQYFKEIKRIERFSDKEIKFYQEEKLKLVLLYAWKNVPYYHNVLSSTEVVNNDKVNLSNFSKIPVLTKKIIRKEGKNLYSVKRRNGSYENTSGGSTGEPVRFLQDKEYDDWNIATKISYKKYGGQDIGERELRLWGSERDLLEGKEKLSIRLRNWLYNRKELNSFKMSENNMRNFVQEWNKFKPTWVEAYVQSIYEFARFIKKNNLPIYSPKGVLTSAGTLYPEMKDLIGDVFNCSVFNRYGSREVGAVACSCTENKGLHLSVFNNYLEILDKKHKPCLPDEIGKVFITTLNNFSMPLIRYDIGDIGSFSKEKCSCGVNLPLLEKIEGREITVFKTKNGKIIPGEFFIHFIGVVFNKDAISKFQVIQKDYDLIEIKVVLANRSKFEKDKPEIEQSIRKTMGSECRIKWLVVNSIPSLKNGKYLYTISLVE
ncbi:MAG: phenylacetate--CoA ligase family protein [Patescibacteria group bacterium]|jgi:phenylacetate-CoA ligase